MSAIVSRAYKFGPTPRTRHTNWLPHYGRSRCFRGLPSNIMSDYCSLIKKAQSISRNFPEPWFSTSTGYNQDQRKPKCATTFQRGCKEPSAPPDALSLNKCCCNGNRGENLYTSCPKIMSEMHLARKIHYERIGVFSFDSV